MNEKEIKFVETRLPILKRHYTLVSRINGQINEEETKKTFIYIRQLQQENARLKDKIEKAIKYLYEHSEYNDEYGIHYIDEDEYCVDYLLDILKEN